METLTIKLLHERKTRRPHRKCDGYSGKLYAFTWNDDHSAYCFTTAKQEEVDDLFNSQGRSSSYFAPVIALGPVTPRAKQLSALIEHELTVRGITLEDGLDTDPVGTAVLAAWEKGLEAALARLTPATISEGDPQAQAPAVEQAQAEVAAPAKKKKRAEPTPA